MIVVVYHWHFYDDLQLKNKNNFCWIGSCSKCWCSAPSFGVNETLAGQQMASNEILLRPSNNNNNDDDDERNKPTSNSFSPFIEKVFLFTYLLTLLGSFISFYHFFLDLWILLSSKLKLVFFFVFGQYFFFSLTIQLWRAIVGQTSRNNYNLSQWNFADI